MKHNSATDKKIQLMLDEAEAQKTCVHPDHECDRSALSRRVAEGEVVCPVRGLYASAGTWDGLSRGEKMLRVIRSEASLHEGWVFSHASAAVAWGLDVPDGILWPIHYVTELRCGGRCPSHHVHHRAERPESTAINGAQVTELAATVLDCACFYEFAPALAIADSALHLGLVCKEELEACLARRSGARGIRRARRVVEEASDLPQSGGESIVRAHMIDLGLPRPELQAPVPDISRPGEFHHVDFLFSSADGGPVAFELDGLEKYQNIQMTRGKSAVQIMAEERQREASITASGIRVARMGFQQANDPSELLRRLAAYGIAPEP